MNYKIDINDNYYLEVDKSYDTTCIGNDLYVGIIVTIHHKIHNHNTFSPIRLVECIYEYKLFSKLFKQSWKERVNKNEVKLINKAKKIIKKLPDLEASVMEKCE